MQHWEKQKAQHDARYSSGPRDHTVSSDPLVNYVTRWRLREAFRRLQDACDNRIDAESSILVLCAGEGLEGSVLCDMGYQDVTVSDISDVGVEQALKRASACSSDPLCSEHDPKEDRSLHGATCHACGFVAETSCEKANRYLDRALIVPTFQNTDLAFFES